MPKPNQQLYGLEWPPGMSTIDIIKDCVRNGGQWKDEDGDTVGAPLFDLYRDAQTYLWGERCQHNDWTDLILKTILDERITAVQGPHDSSKTHTMARYALCDYFFFPRETLILMSSTDIRGLELRVWGEVKELYNLAKETWPEVPGVAVDSMHGIFTDQLVDGGDARDIRRGLICFPKGTLVDTPNGATAIEELKEGDEVVNATGLGRIKETHCSVSNSLVRVTLSDGRIIDCTPNHPILTRRGWTKAVDLKTFDTVYSAHETMRILQRPTRGRLSEQAILLREMSRLCASANLRYLRHEVSTNKRPSISQRKLGKVLQSDMCEHLAQGELRVGSCYSQLQGLWKEDEGRIRWHGVLFDRMPQSSEASEMQGMWPEIRFHSAVTHEATNVFLQCLLQMEMGRSEVRQKVHGVHTPRKGFGGRVFWHEATAFGVHRETASEKHQAPLHSGCGISESEAGCGTGWRGAFGSGEEGTRRETNQRPEKTWVVSVKVLKSSSGSGYGEGEEGCPVYNLEVSGHPSYSVNGIIVHNCLPVLDSENQWKGIQKWVGVKQKRRRILADETQFYALPFIDTLANINKQRSDFKGVFVGNPIGEDDPLDRIAEPEDGWDNLPEITTTTTWRNKMGGVTVQLLGSDSPAIRFPGQYHYLIDQSDLDYISGYWGRESSKWWNQGLGVRRPGINERRIITRDMVNKFNAQGEVTWKGKELTKVYAVDAGYGGDRCIGGEAEFGEDVNGVQILLMGNPRLIPVRLFPKGTPEVERILPEDQIALFVKADCERLGIPSANVFHDSTGRGSLGSAFARTWGRTDTNPVEFGGSPTPRPVLADLFIYDEKEKKKRLKRCDEHYSKRVSELHFSVRYTIEGRQMRGLTNDVRDELCIREWNLVKGNKIEVENKDDTKERLGRSPDKGDWAAIIVEAARSRGFLISRMTAQAPESKKQDDKWKDDMIARARKLKASYTLQPA